MVELAVTKLSTFKKNQQLYCVRKNNESYKFQTLFVTPKNNKQVLEYIFKFFFSNEFI